jgi:hypothetical protein
MKTFNTRCAVILFSVLIFHSCKKTSNEPGNSGMQGFSFEYNSKTYNETIVNNTTDCGLEFNGAYDAIGVIIDKPNVFGGKIIFHTPDCAYIVPSTNWDMDENCSINAHGESYDSSSVYYYKSGSFMSTKSNCVEKSGTDIYTNLPYRYMICDYLGTFSLILENKKGETIEITNGSFNKTYQFDL